MTRMLVRFLPVAAILVAGLARAEHDLVSGQEAQGGGIVIPDPTAITEEDEKAVRQMMTDYHKAVESGDRAKALSFCIYKGKLQETVSKLGCEVDFSIAALHTAVEKKFGKEAWPHIGKMMAEMNTEVLKSLQLESEENPDEVRASWNEEVDVGKDRHFPSYISLRKNKNDWKFVFSEDKDELLELRKQFRDEIAELAAISAKVEDGTYKDVDALKDALNTLIEEMIGPAEEGDHDMPNPPAADDPPGAMIQQ